MKESQQLKLAVSAVVATTTTTIYREKVTPVRLVVFRLCNCRLLTNCRNSITRCNKFVIVWFTLRYFAGLLFISIPSSISVARNRIISSHCSIPLASQMPPSIVLHVVHRELVERSRAAYLVSFCQLLRLGECRKKCEQVYPR